MAVTVVVGRFIEIERKTMGAMLVSTMIANNRIYGPDILIHCPAG